MKIRSSPEECSSSSVKVWFETEEAPFGTATHEGFDNIQIKKGEDGALYLFDGDGRMIDHYKPGVWKTVEVVLVLEPS